MRRVKSLKPIDWVVRGAFVAVVLGGGLADMAKPAPALQAGIVAPALCTAQASLHTTIHPRQSRALATAPCIGQ